MTNISINNLNAYDIWQKLDAKDGSDGKITKNIWDEFRNVIGMGNTINNYITEQNALKSIKYYLKNISEEVAQKLANYIGISSSDEKLTPIEPQDEVEEPIENNPPRDNVDETVQDDTHTDATDTYNPADKADGFIDPTVQQSTGDCWLLSGLNALSETQWGRDAIKQAINIKQNGDIVITLKGAYGKKKQFLITKSELEVNKNNPKYSKGDMDVLAIELAVEKYRKQFGETLDGGQEEEIFRLITGSHNTQTIQSKQGIKSTLQKAKANPEKYVISANFYLGKEAGRDAYHAYNVSRFETDEYGQNWVILTNPWDARREIRITESEFSKYAVEIQVIANPNGNTKTTPINSDGKIGTTKGGKKGVDGPVAAAIHAVANMNSQIIKDSISRDNKGNIKVTLKGVGETFTITQKEIAKAKDSGKYTEGDDDVIAIEIAIEKYGKKKYQTNGLADVPVFAGLVQSGTDLYGISDTTVIRLLTGQDNKYAVLDDKGKYQVSDSPYGNNGNVDLAEIAKKIKEFGI